MSISTAIARAFSVIAEVIVNAAAAAGMAAGGPGDSLHTRKCYPGGRLRRSVRNACGVERAVIEQWLMWRH